MIHFFSIRKLLIFTLFIITGLAFLGSCNKRDGYTAPPPATPVQPVPDPVLTSFTPASAAKDSTILITGTGFSTTASDNKVLFNGVAGSVTAATATSLTVKVPAGAQDGKISISIGAHTTRSANDFTYIYTVSTLAGDGTLGFKDGAGKDAKFQDAFGLTVDAAGNVYVADGSNNRVRKITPAGEVSTLAGSGAIGYKDGAGNEALFNYPHGLAVDADGNVYVADAGNNRIRKITPAGEVSTLAGSGDPAFADGDGKAASFNFPADLVLDGSGNVFVSDGTNHRIRKITPAGRVTTLTGEAFGFPEGITIDPSGNLYVADAGSGLIRKVTPAGIVTDIAGSVANRGYVDAKGPNAQFHNPEGIAIDAHGNLYVGDLNAAIRKVTPAGEVSTLAGNGVGGFKDGAAPDARFHEPSGIAADPAGNIYVADVGNSRIRKIQ